MCYDVVIIYLDYSKIEVNGKIYSRYFLRESYREGKQVKNRTIANLSRCFPEEIEATRLALHHKKNLDGLKLGQNEDISIKQGLSV